MSRIGRIVPLAVALGLSLVLAGPASAKARPAAPGASVPASSGTVSAAPPPARPDEWSRTRRFIVVAVLTIVVIWIFDGAPGERESGRRSMRTSLHELPPTPQAAANFTGSRPGRPPPLR